MNYLSFDIGTSAAKCQLYSEDGEILEYLREEYELLTVEGDLYIDTAKILDVVKDMLRKVTEKHRVDSLAISSLGESFVLLDDMDNILFHPMLYTDPRGDDEAKEISELLGDETVFKITGTVPTAMYSVSKLLMIKKHYPEIYARAKRVMLMADYFGFLLTGERVIDYGLAARTGAFDVTELKFSEKVLTALGIDKDIFSRPMRAGSRVGPIKREFISDKSKDAPMLILGSHDQICTTLGAGALKPGEAVDGLGTVECITVLFDKKPDDIRMGRQGYPAVPFAVEGLYCTYALNYSCGSLVTWFRKKIMHDYKGNSSSFFEYIEGKMPGVPTELLVLPYFGGAATPYDDINAKGAVIGLTSETSDSEIYRAILEATALEMRLNSEVLSEYGIKLSEAVATGGGANSDAWLKIKADIQCIPYKTLNSSEGGLVGCAMLQALGMGQVSSLEKAKEIFVKYSRSHSPSDVYKNQYDKSYKSYKKLYKTLKEI